jgi:hypothetical protein
LAQRKQNNQKKEYGSASARLGKQSLVLDKTFSTSARLKNCII